MAKIRTVTEGEKTLFLQEFKVCQDKIDEIKTREQNLLLMVKDYSEEAPIAHLALSDEMLNLAECQIEINSLSNELLAKKDEEILNEARKTIYKSIIYLENVVTNLVDAPYADYAENLEKIASFDASQRYNLVEKMGKTINLLKEAYGDNTKWKWSFVEVEGRFAAVAKNIMDLKSAVSNTDPRSPQYEPTLRHLQMIKELLMRAANRYREKYEMSTKQTDDFQKGINFLRSLFRIHALMGEKNDATEIKKKHEVWISKLETDLKNKKARQ